MKRERETDKEIDVQKQRFRADAADISDIFGKVRQSLFSLCVRTMRTFFQSEYFV